MLKKKVVLIRIKMIVLFIMGSMNVFGASGIFNEWNEVKSKKYAIKVNDMKSGFFKATIDSVKDNLYYFHSKCSVYVKSGYNLPALTKIGINNKDVANLIVDYTQGFSHVYNITYCLDSLGRGVEEYGWFKVYYQKRNKPVDSVFVDIEYKEKELTVILYQNDSPKEYKVASSLPPYIFMPNDFLIQELLAFQLKGGKNNYMVLFPLSLFLTNGYNFNVVGNDDKKNKSNCIDVVLEIPGMSKSEFKYCYDESGIIDNFRSGKKSEKNEIEIKRLRPK